ncbi:toxin-antitoxin system HicB family antitoxin [Paenibacillus sp.]|uniref:toxin-antitoxin system HicB family antitoxin n=1 Tax=Paenibacillus sp. TaxID=58172 RepID=UPI002D682A3C|nr:toxin-antitoxin system HicB family antitoxin [Paenibacillus sp.]HZG58189.1 toxin-antitoxin system HicB family antitoxin [Paenibacillus sp.]
MAGKKQYPLRIDAAVYDALERWAADEFRSVNAHIEYVLREALRQAGRLPGPRRPAEHEDEGGAPGGPGNSPGAGRPD